MKPKSILDSAFRYTPSASTDLRKTFAKARKEQADAAKRLEAERLEAIARTVTPFRSGR